MAAGNETLRDLFTTAQAAVQTAQRLGATPQSAVKNFWVCWTLDVLFNGSKWPRPALIHSAHALPGRGRSMSRFWDKIVILHGLRRGSLHRPSLSSLTRP